MTVYIVKIKIHENSTEEFSYVEPKSYDMSGKIFAFQEKLRYVLHCNLRLGTFRNIHSVFKNIYCIVNVCSFINHRHSIPLIFCFVPPPQMS